MLHYILVGLMSLYNLFNNHDVSKEKQKELMKSAQTHIRSFEKEFGIKVNTDITFVTQTTSDAEGTVGTCFMYTNSVEILAPFYEESSDATREQLIWHELGHCMALLEHNEEMFLPSDDIFEVDIPVSIMYPTLMDDWAYLRNRDHYINELRAEIQNNKKSSRYFLWP